MRAISLPEPDSGHAAPITHVAFAPGGAWLSTASYDGTAIVWRVDRRVPAQQQPVSRIRHRRLVNATAWSREHPGWLATASADKTVGLWRVDQADGTVEELGRLARHTDDVNAVAWLPDGERIVTASEDSTSLIWEARTGRYLGRIHAHAGHCMGIAVSPAGVVLTVGEDGEVFAGDPDGRRGDHQRNFPTSVEGCVWSADGTRAALACDDGLVRVVSPELDLLEELPVTASAARAVAFATDGSGRLVVGSYDASVQVLRGGAVESRVAGRRLWPRSVDTFGDTVAVGSFGSSPVVLDLDGLGVRHDGGPGTHGPNALAFDGSRVAVGLDSGLVVTLPRADLAQGRAEAATVLPVSDDPVLSLAPAPGGWVAGTYTGLVHRIDGTSGQAVAPALDLGAPVPSLAAHPERALALAGTYGGTVAVLDLTDGLSVSVESRPHHGSVKSLAWRDGAHAVSGATDARVRAFDVVEHRFGSQDQLLWEHGNLVNAVAADARGLVASASRDRLVRVGDGTSPSMALLGADESMKAVAVLGQGDEVVVLGGSYDFTCYWWTYRLGAVTQNGTELDGTGLDARAGSVLFGADQAISTMVTLDATTAVAASWDGTIRTLELVGGRVQVGPALAVEQLLDAAGPRPGLADAEMGGQRVGA